MTESVYVLGAGGHAKVLVDTLKHAGHTIAGLVDDDPARHGTSVLGVPVLGSLELLKRSSDISAVIGVGDNRTRARLARRFEGRIRWVSVVHPNADVGADVSIGAGTVVFSGAVIQPGARIGNHVIVNTSASVDHDCRLGDYVHCAPGTRLAGDVHLGEGVMLGIGAVVIPGIRVGDWTTVGAGAAVVRDLPDGVTAVGVPATIIKEAQS